MKMMRSQAGRMVMTIQAGLMVAVCWLVARLAVRGRRGRLGFRMAAVGVAIALCAGAVGAVPARAATSGGVPITWPGGDLDFSYDATNISPSISQYIVTTEWPEYVGLSADPSLDELLYNTWLKTNNNVAPVQTPPSFDGGSITVTPDSGSGSIIEFSVPAADVSAVATGALRSFLVGLASSVAGGFASIITSAFCGAALYPGGNPDDATKAITTFCGAVGALSWTAVTATLNSFFADNPPGFSIANLVGLFLGAALAAVNVSYLTPPAIRAVLAAAGALATAAAGIGQAFSSYMASADVENAGLDLGDLENSIQNALSSNPNLQEVLSSMQEASAWGTEVQGLIENVGQGGAGASAANCMDAYGTTGTIVPSPLLLGAAPGAAVAINTCKGSGAQTWTVWASGNITVWGLCLEGLGGVVDLQQCDGASNQIWYPYQGELVNAANGQCLDDPASNTTPGTGLITFTCKNGANQMWALPAGGQYVTSYGTVNNTSALCMDAYGSNGAPAPGQKVAINQCNGNTNQGWTVGANGSVMVWGMCMDSSGGGTDSAGDPLVVLEYCDSSSSQSWSVSGNELINGSNGQCLDDPASNTTPGTQLITFPCKNGANERWTLPNPSPSARSVPPSACDIYGDYGTPCVAAYSTTRALFSSYDGPLYQVTRASDNTTANIGLLATGGDVNASEQDSFCAGTTCTITEIYDQSAEGNNLTIEQGGGADHSPDSGAVANALPITIGGNEAYGVDIEQGTGYRDDATHGIATNGEPEGMYMVASGTHVNSQCCFDFGNVETDNNDDNYGRMDAVNLTTWCGNNSGTCTGSGPWVEADLENGQWMGNGPNPGDTGNSSNYVTAMLKNNGQNTFELQGGDSTTGGLTQWYDGALPSQYQPMHQEGAIVLGTGGDNSNSDVGSFFEGVMTSGFPSDAADAAVQANIVAAGYAGSTNPAGFTSPVAGSSAPASAAGAAVVHQGYSSVFTVDAANGHLQESYLPQMYQSWLTHDLGSTLPTMPDTPAVMPGTQPVALVHCGFTSVFTVDAGDATHGTGDLQETYLPAVGQSWSTQDLSQVGATTPGTPPTDVTPTAVEYDSGVPGGTAGCGYTSVFSRDRNGDLQETYLPNTGFPGDPWLTHDLGSSLPTMPSTPEIQPGTSPVALVHCGFLSVYTVDASNHHLQESYLPAFGDSWSTQDLSRNYGNASATTYNTPPTVNTPTAVMHSAGVPGGTAACGYTSVFTVDDVTRHLQETYLPNTGFPGDPWLTHDLGSTAPTMPDTPPVAPGTQPVALVHMGYTSVYTVDEASNHLEETYLPAFGDSWTYQDLTNNYQAPVTDQSPIVLEHPDATGNMDWTSVFTIDEFNAHLQETYLPNTGFPGDSWLTHDLGSSLPTMPITPPVAELQSQQSDWSVAHAGYTSTYTVNGNGDLEETYLPKMYGAWSSQDLSSSLPNMAGTPAVAASTTPAAIYHEGVTSVFTHDSGSGDLQVTYLNAIGGGWVTQNLSSAAGTPVIAQGSSPTAVFHDGYTSVYTLDNNGDLQETYQRVLGGGWVTQDLTSMTGGPKTVGSWTSPVAIFHDGYVSVFTEDEGDSNTNPDDLEEYYLPVIGGGWFYHDISEMAGTPELASFTNPTVVYHDGFLSVYTVNDNSGDGYGDLSETYLPAIGDNWTYQDLTQKYHLPVVAQLSSPMALYHTGFTSVYFLDGSGNYQNHLIEAYLPAIGDAWGMNDLTGSTPNTPAPDQSPSPLVHYDSSGGLTWTSVFTIDGGSNDLQETYLPAIGQNWSTQNLSTNTPPNTPPW